MRDVVVIGHEAPTQPSFSLDDLPAAGRMDLLCRCVSAALFTSHGIRTDSRVHLVLNESITICIDGSSVRNARPDERSLAGLIQTGLSGTDDAIGHQPAEPAPGVTVRTRGLEPTLSALDGPILALDERGSALRTDAVPANPVMVVSDHQDFTSEEWEILATQASQQLRLGPEILHADHSIAIVHNWLDTDGYQRY